jgi:hypothetical protein
MKRNTYFFTITILLLINFSLVSSFNFEGEGVKIVEPIEDGSLKVIIQDQHTEIIDLLLHRPLNNLTLNQTYSIGDRNIIVETTGVTPVIGNVVCFKELTAFYQGEILTVTAITGNFYTIELDTPIDFPFSNNTNGCVSTTNMAVDGSVTPQIFYITPYGLNENVEWDITRILFVMSGEGIGATNDHPDDSDFGVTSNLENGIVLRSVNGITKNIFNIKRNGEFRLRAYDVTYTEKSKAGLYSVGVRRSFNGPDKNGVTVRLLAETGDTIEIIIQDDLTEQFGMKAVVQGQVVRN